MKWKHTHEVSAFPIKWFIIPYMCLLPLHVGPHVKDSFYLLCLYFTYTACVYLITDGKQEERRIEGDKEEARWDLERCVSELEDCLQGVLSDVLEREMKAVYEDIWLEVTVNKGLVRF